MSGLREKMFEIITDPPCQECKFWDRRGHYCFLRDIHPTSKKCVLMDSLLALIVEEAEREMPLLMDEHKTGQIGASFDTDYRVITRCVPDCPACRVKAQHQVCIDWLKGLLAKGE